MFGSGDIGKRSADAAEYVARLTYPASWAWGAATALLGDVGDRTPGWVRRAIEFGVPTEAAVEVMREFRVSRTAGIALLSVMPDDWGTARDIVLELTTSDLRELAVPELDRRAIVGTREAGLHT
jgi:hypothetical protein